MTSPIPTADGDATAIEAVNETSIHYTRPATIFAAVSASIFTFVGISGKNSFFARKVNKEVCFSDFILALWPVYLLAHISKSEI